MTELEKMISLIGTNDSNKMILVGNHIMDHYEYDEQKEYMTPAQIKKMDKIKIDVVVSWTWKQQSTRHNAYGWCLVKHDVVYTNAQTGEIISNE